MSWVALAVGVGSAAVSVGTGVSQKNKAKKLEKKAAAEYVPETVPNALLENQANARVRATTGLPSEVYGNAMQNIQRQQMQSLKQAQNRRISGEVVPAIQDNTNNAMLNLDSLNAKQRLANEGNLMKVNQQVAGVQRDIFNKDVRAKYLRDYNYAMSLLGMGNQNISSGINQGIAAAGGAAANGVFGGAGNKSTPLYNQPKADTSSVSGITTPTPTPTYRSGADIIKPIQLYS